MTIQISSGDSSSVAGLDKQQIDGRTQPSSSVVSRVTENYDLLVVGASGGGVMSAIQASRLGLSVCLIYDLEGLGGMSTGGIMFTDTQTADDKALIRGLADEFYGRVQRIGKFPGKQSWLASASYSSLPRYSRQALDEMLAVPNLKIYASEYVTSVNKTGTVINSVVTNNRTINAKVFIDGTYTGDLQALSGCTNIIGRESNSSETLNGVNGVSNIQFDYPIGSGTLVVDPYRTAGDSTSGILPGIFTSSDGSINSTGSNVSSSGTSAGSTDLPISLTGGAASPFVQSMTYRLLLCNDSNKIAIPDPVNYDATQYELFGRWISAAITGGRTFNQLSNINNTGVMILYTLQSSGNVDTNTAVAISFDYVGAECTEYITATRDRRLAIEAKIKDYVLGLFKFLKTDSRVPAGVKSDIFTSAGAGNYGFDSREYKGNGGFPPALYVREGRRLVGDYVASQTSVTVNATTTGQLITDPIAMVYYNQDSHVCTRYISGGHARNEGGYNSAIATAQIGCWISQKVLYPKVAECTNLMSVFGSSSTHVAHSSIRLEPISMLMGEAAGCIAYWKIKEQLNYATAVNVQDCPNSEVQRLINLFGDNVPGDGAILSADGTYTGGTVTILSGTWNQSSQPLGSSKSKHKAATDPNTGTPVSIKFAPNLSESGLFDVYINYYVRTASTRSTATQVVVSHADGTSTITVNQNQTGQSGDWLLIGSFPFNSGAPSENYVQINTDGIGGSSVINACKWIKRA